VESARTDHRRIPLSNHGPDAPAAATRVRLHLAQLDLKETVVPSGRKLFGQAEAKNPRGACTIAAE
jgi:hypothetical protein